MRSAPWTAALCAIALGLAVTTGARATTEAAEIEGVSFDRELQLEDGPTLQLHRVALLRYRVFFKGYVAALYLEAGTPPDAVLDDLPRRLEIEYFWSIDAEDFQQATIDGIARNVDAAEYAGLRREIGELNELYRSVKPGDRYALTYVPGVGTELTYNATPLGTVEGSRFARALFSIWLGTVPFDDTLKSDLLGSS